MSGLIGYIRVSTEEQAQQGLSLPDQEARLWEYASQHGKTLVNLYRDEGVSASIPLEKRPAGRQLLAKISKAGKSGVVAIKLDRMFRSALDCLQNVEVWTKKNVPFHLVDHGGAPVDTSSPAGKCFLTNMAAFAEMERAMTSERTKAAMRHKRKNLEYCGGKPPYGWRQTADGVHLEPCPEEVEVCAYVHLLRGQELSYHKIADILNKEGYTTRSGEFFPPLVRTICLSPVPCDEPGE